MRSPLEIQPWIIAVFTVVGAVIAVLVGVGIAAQRGQFDDLPKLVAEKERLFRERVNIHGDAAGLCLHQQRVLMVAMTRQCTRCAANTRQVNALIRQMPRPAQIIYWIMAPVRCLNHVNRIRRHLARNRAQARRLRPKEVSVGPFSRPGVLARRELMRVAEQFREAAEAGDPKAQYFFALQCEKMADNDTARTWYRKAADQGHALATTNLGTLHFYAGEPTEALALYEAAGELGDAVGAFNASTVATHLGDAMKAHGWRLRAAELGHPGARAALDAHAQMAPGSTDSPSS